MYKISLEEICIFLEVAKCRSFTEASNHLYISQPTVTKWIRCLEDELGFQLFIRNSRHVTLTPAGNILLERWNKLRPEFENSLKQAHDISVINQKALKIGILYGFDFETLLASLIPEFEKSVPSVKTDINIYDFNEMRNKTDELDFVFSTNFEIESRSEYITHCINKISMYLAVSPQHPLANREYVTPAEICSETFVVISSLISPNVMPHFDRIFGMYNPSPRLISVENVPSQLLKVIKNEGVAITSRAFLKGHESQIILIELRNFLLNSYRVCAWKENSLSTAGHKFKNFILNFNNLSDST